MKNRFDFQDGRHGGRLGFPIGTILAKLIYKSPEASYQVSSQLVFGFRRRSENNFFQDGHHGGNLGFSISMILATFDLQVTLRLPTKL